MVAKDGENLSFLFFFWMSVLFLGNMVAEWLPVNVSVYVLAL